MQILNKNVEPILINSSLVSAQNRKRLYWTNIPNISQPVDKNIHINDILISDKNSLIGAARGRYKVNNIRQDHKHSIQQIIEVRKDNKSNCITTVQKDNYVILYRIPHGYVTEELTHVQKYPTLCTVNPQCHYLIVDNTMCRQLLPIECERLQTVPDNYTSIVSNNQRYKMIGNGWTIDVIAHILNHISQ